jgi:hypothetical protein
MTKEYEFYRAGLYKKITVKDHSYDLVEFTFHQQLTDEQGKTIMDSKYESFFTTREFKDFMTPFVNDMKVRFENADSIQE